MEVPRKNRLKEMDSSFEMEDLDDIDISLIEEEISSLYEEIKEAVSEDELSSSSEELSVIGVSNERRSHKVSEKSPPETSTTDNLQDSSGRNENTELGNRVGNKNQEFGDASLVHFKNINVEKPSLLERTRDEKEYSDEDLLTSDNKENTSFKGVVCNEEEPLNDIFQVECEERKSCSEKSKKEEKASNQEILNKRMCSIDNLQKCTRKEFAKVANQKKSDYKKVNVILKMLCKLFVTHIQGVP